MLPRLQFRFDRLERQRRALLDQLARQDPRVLGYQPAPAAWSIVQVVEHLVLAEEGLMNLVDTRPPKPVPLKARIRSAIVLRLVYRVLNSRRRVKVPRPTLNPSGNDIGLEELARRWAAVRDRMEQALEAVTPASRSERPIGHPIAKWLTWDQGLEFLFRHVRHHEKQIGRIEEARVGASAPA
jgi:hypothetical protein